MESTNLNTTLTFTSLVHHEIQAVEVLMASQAEGYHPDLQAALSHLLTSGGKRIRPSLTLLVGSMLKADREKLITLAASIELLHTATLVHDDLIDGSLLRRGIPTLNSRWSPAATVLTGDFLFSRAAKLASDTNSIKVMDLFSRTLTVIVNGEITQLFTSRCKFDKEEYYRRIYAKTASLFETACQAAALISDTNIEVIEATRQYGYEIGMAFQIIDDILDFTADQSKLGKPVGNDLRQGLVTLPAIQFVQMHPEDELSQSILAGECLTEYQVEEMVKRIHRSEAIHAAHQEAKDYAARGLSALQILPNCVQKTALEEIGRYTVNRDF